MIDPTVSDTLDIIINTFYRGYKKGKEDASIHAHWFLLDECSNAGVYCSNCHKKVYKEQYANQKIKSRYCPNCGAKMDGDCK